MKLKRYALIALVLTATWPANLGAAGNASAGSQTPPAPPGSVDLEGSIQPPIQPAEPPRVIPPAPRIPANVPSAQLSDNILAWDGAEKEETVAAGTTEAHFKFSLTNVSPDVVTVFNVHSSCGCTTAQLPPMPWKLAPGTNSEINITMNLAGKNGTVFKTVTISTDKGNKTLVVKTIITQPPANSTAIRPVAGKAFLSAALHNLPVSSELAGSSHTAGSMAIEGSRMSGPEDQKGHAHVLVKVSPA